MSAGINLDTFGKPDGVAALIDDADDFQLGWNHAGKGKRLPKRCSEQFANGFWQYHELHDATGDVWGS